MTNKFQQYNETDPLKKVIVGRYRGYRAEEAYVERVNASQKSGLPSKSQLELEFSAFANILSERGIEVLTPEYVGKFVYDQLTPRDLGVTIGDKFVLCNMANGSRRYEAAGIFNHILAMDGEEPTIILPPDPEILLEGGDIIVDRGYIFAGLSSRTNQAGINFLIDTFEPEFEVIPLPCKSFNDDQHVLHLDCVFNPVGDDHALIYPPGLKHIPNAINDNYQLIEIDKNAQQALATNVLSLDKNLVVTRGHPDCKSVNDAMRQAGIEVIEQKFDGAPSTGGSFRCCSLPLVRARTD